MNKARKTITVLAAASLCMLLTACGSKVVYYTADDCVEVSASGIDGSGTATISFDKKTLLDKINNDIYKGKADDMELAKAEVALYQYINIDVPDDNTDELSNGDKIVVNVTADNEALAELGFGIDTDNAVYVYTVEGLTEPTVIDLFEDVSLNVEGISPYLNVTAEYTGNDEFIKDNVRYYTDTGTYYFANGDKVNVTANVYEGTLAENNYIVECTEKEFEISGYDQYANKDSDFTAAYDYIDDYAHSAIKDGGNYGLNWEHDARAFFKNGDAFEFWTIRKEEITPVKAVLYTKDNSLSWSKSNNSYNIFYRIDMEIEKTDEKYGRPKTDYNFGDKETSEIYFCVALSNIVEKPDGTIEFNEDNRSIITYSTSLLYNYVGADLDEVAAVRDKDMSGFTRDELEVK